MNSAEPRSLILQALGRTDLLEGFNGDDHVIRAYDGKRFLGELHLNSGLSAAYDGPERQWDGMTWFGSGHTIESARAALLHFLFTGDESLFGRVELRVDRRL